MSPVFGGATSDRTLPFSDKGIPISCQNVASLISVPCFSQQFVRHSFVLCPRIGKLPKTLALRHPGGQLQSTTGKVFACSTPSGVTGALISLRNGCVTDDLDSWRLRSQSPYRGASSTDRRSTIAPNEAHCRSA